MLKTMALVAALAFAAGCKSDEPTAVTPTSAERSDSTAEPGRTGRSAKIDPVMPRRIGPRLDDRAGSGDPGDNRRQRRMSMLDTDGDGTISDAEREAMQARREAMRAEREAEMIARLDSDGDGAVSDAERAAARVARAEDMKARLDADGDGKLTTAELDSSPRRRRFDAATADVDKNGEITTEELSTALDAQRQGRGGRGGGGGRWRDRGGDDAGSASTGSTD
jgi:hypothetical protein